MIKLAKGAANEGETIKSAVHNRIQARSNSVVKSGQPVKQVATTLGMPHQTLDNWLRADNLGKLSGAGERVVTPEQMELTRLRAENARLKMERDI